MLFTRVEQERTENGGGGSRVESAEPEWAGRHDVFVSVFGRSITFWYSNSFKLFAVDRLRRATNVR